MKQRGASDRKSGPASTDKALLAALDRLPVAFALFDAKRRLAAWNAPLASLGLFPKSIFRAGVSFAEFQRRDTGLKRKTTAPHDVALDGRVLEATRKRVPPGHVLLTYEDVTDARTARLEATEALERQNATTDILTAIARSPTAGQETLDAVAAAAARFCGATDVLILTVDGAMLRRRAHFGPIKSVSEVRPLVGGTPGEISVLERRTVHVDDIVQALRQGKYPGARELQKASGFRTLLSVPLIREDVAIGVMSMRRQEVRPFTQKQIQLAESFAAQAVIAIENVRLFNETREALERQTATAEILKVIASSPTNVQPVFDTVAQNAARLCEAPDVVIVMAEHDSLRFAASTGPFGRSFEPGFTIPIDRRSVAGRAYVERRTIHIDDLAAVSQDDYPVGKSLQRRYGHRTMVAVPLLRGGTALGDIVVLRKEVKPFSDKQVALLQTFADQAVIAIENVRLFNELDARNADLTKALAQQTATADILRVIGASPTDAQPVFNAIVKSALRLLRGMSAAVYRLDHEMIHLVAYTSLNEAGDAAFRAVFPRPLAEAVFQAEALRERAPFVITDANTDPRVNEVAREVFKARGYGSVVYVPMFKDGAPVGNISVARQKAGAFTADELALLQTFADQAAIAIENARLFNETKEALERQTATAEILRVISSSPTDIDPVLDAVCKSAARLCEATDVLIRRVEGGALRAVAHIGSIPLPAAVQAPAISPTHIAGRSVLERRTIHVHDVTDPEVIREYPDRLSRAQKGEGFKTVLIVPLIRNDEAIGMIAIRRVEKRPFSDQQISLLQAFADQAVIAIENVRLFNETREALERQTATADILKVIASSPSDVQPVFDVIVERAVKLCGARFGRVYRYDGSIIEMVAGHGLSSGGLQQVQRVFPRRAADDTIVGRVILGRQPYFLKDVQRATAVPVLSRQMIEALGTRSQVTIPMLRSGEPIGAITLGWDQPDAFDDRQVTLLQTFADQAVIAIENVRLFNETKEALDRQTATAEVLQVISGSPTDVQPVFDTIAERAATLCAAKISTVTRFDGELVHLVAYHGAESEEALAERRAVYPIKPGSGSVNSRAIRDRAPAQIPDLLADPDYLRKEASIRTGFRSSLAVPMMREGQCVGSIAVARAETGLFPQKQVDLLKTFADQAVIAIENVRLFNETKEALERQTATSEVLKTISRSTFDLNAVLQVLIENATRLAGANQGFIFRFDGEVARLACAYNAPADYQALISENPIRPGRGALVARVLLERKPVHIPDVLEDEEFTWHEAQRRGGFRSMFGVPMMREGNLIGVIAIWKTEVRPFTEKQIELVSTFADQAVIAIENVRLFNETKEALEQQTAISEVLRVISSSPADVQPVLEAVAVRAAKICDASDARIALVEGDHFRHAAGFGDLPPTRERVPLERGVPIGRAVIDRKTVYIRDIQAETDEDFALGREIAAQSGWRSNLVVPLMRKDSAVGAIALRRRDVRPFSPKQISLLQTFADQAAIAIENVRLFNETREALERQTATAEILKVIASSPSDVQPVFDAIAASARRLLDGGAALVNRRVGDMLELAAYTSTGEAGDAALRKLFPAKLTGKGHMGKAILTGAPILISDIEAEEGYSEAFKADARTRGFRSVVSVPMMKDGEPIGGISVNRPVAGNFTEHQTNLLKTFADQAVIAIENVRLFNETKEALQRQTATADILKVIASSPADVAPVFKAIGESAANLCDAVYSAVLPVENGMLHLGSTYNWKGEGFATAQRLFPMPVTANHLSAMAVRERRVIALDNLQRDPNVPATSRELAAATGYDSIAIVPMIREGSSQGALVVARRAPFTRDQVALLQTFADQAVIAIENVRLFNETKEALERQTATSEVLNVIARSPSDVQPVLDAVAESAARLCGASDALIMTSEAGMLVRRAHFGPVQSVSAARPLTRGTPTGRAVLERCTVHVEDVLAEIERGDYLEAAELQRRNGMRTILSVPLVREDSVIGVISMRRLEVRPFTEKQIALVKTFADQAVIAIENVRLFNETKEALERQTATAEILQVIGSSPTDTQPVFDAIVNSGVRLFPGAMITVARPDGGSVRAAAIAHEDTTMVAGWKERFATPLSRDRLHAAAILDAELIDIPDADAEKDGPLGPGVRNFLLSGNRAVTIMPMLRGEGAIGAISVTRRVPGPLSDKQIAILRTFADQAVIAIENVRLFNETKEALERQTATAEILKVIASSPSDVQPVFDAIAASARRLLNGRGAVVARRVGDSLHLAAHTATTEAGDAWVKAIFPTPITGQGVMGKAVLSGEPVWIEDIEKGATYSASFREGARARDVRSVISVPMLREGEVVGGINVERSEPGPFSEHQTNLLKTFADQAVIAIENVRLFNETKEALERQTATAEVLKVISGSLTDTQPVFDTIAERAARLTGAAFGWVFTLHDGLIHATSSFGLNPQAVEVARKAFPMPPGGGSYTARAIRNGQILNVGDALAETDPDYLTKPVAAAAGYRSVLAVPMFRERQVVGAIVVNRAEPGQFADKEVELLKTFADQAVIAIENVRLFNETKEALERQTATAEILKVISSSPTDEKPVFDAIVQSAARLFGRSARIRLIEDGMLHLRATSDATASTALPAPPFALDARSVGGRVFHERAPMQVADIEAPDAPALAVATGRAAGYRSIAAAPLMRKNEVIGVILVTSPKPGALSEKEMSMLVTFANQAVIAIENVRLFKELQQRTDALSKSVQQLTALGEVGQAISSTLELDKVLQTIAQHAVQLTGLDGASIYEYDEANEMFRVQAADNLAPAFLQAIRDTPIRKGDGTVGGVAITQEPVQVSDIGDDSYKSTRKELLIRAGYRAILTVPLLHEDHIIGALSVTRKTPGAFAEEIVELMKTFASQSAMAIQNARLFREIEEKGKQLEEASKHKSQFLASMSHELRTPLNAILGFNEMILGDVYGEVPTDMKEPLTDIQTSGKHLLRLINNVLDLAKIEAGRMELAIDEYSVHDTVESVRSTLRPLAEAKGLDLAVDVPPDIPLARGDGGRITQCLMNLAGNSLKFTKQGSVGISVALNNGTLTYKVQDTGIGIPADKIGGLFTEFKQTDATIASEYGGTGLGLSITKKFIEMHGGRIWAESEPGSGSTFIFEVPLRAGETGGA